MPWLVTKQEWEKANAFFLENQTAIKLKKKNQDEHSFVKIESQIVALARAKHPDEGILGIGGYAIVKEGITESNQAYAIKIQGLSFRPNAHDIMRRLGFAHGFAMRELEKEIDYLKNKITKKYYSALTLVPGEELSDIKVNLLSEIQKKLIALKCCTKIYFYHQLNIIHADLKPSNIKIVINDYHIEIYLLDFDCVFELEADEISVTFDSPRGTIGFAAPEVLIYNQCSYASDVFSLGGVLSFLGVKEYEKSMLAPNPAERPPLPVIIAKLIQDIKQFNIEDTEISKVLAEATTQIQDHLSQPRRFDLESFLWIYASFLTLDQRWDLVHQFINKLIASQRKDKLPPVPFNQIFLVFSQDSLEIQDMNIIDPSVYNPALCYKADHHAVASLMRRLNLQNNLIKKGDFYDMTFTEFTQALFPGGKALLPQYSQARHTGTHDLSAMPLSINATARI